jgi:thiamine pyrophosphokinase
VSRVHRALVIAAVDTDEIVILPEADLVVAADSGADVALAAGRAIDVLVGDMDSISPRALEAARRDGVRILEHPADKEETDLELALSIAATEASHVHVVMGAGGRLDHAVANLAVIASPRWAAATIDATVGPHLVTVVRGEHTLAGAVGDVVSLIPMGGPAFGVTTQGLRFPLDGETLDPLSGRGVSNTIVAVPAMVTVAGGVLLAVRPLSP